MLDGSLTREFEHHVKATVPVSVCCGLLVRCWQYCIATIAPSAILVVGVCREKTS